MKKIITLTSFLVCLATQLIAQTDSTVSISQETVVPAVVVPDAYHRPFYATITLTDGKVRKGWMYKMNDAEMVFIPGGRSAVKGWNSPSFLPENSFSIANENVQKITGHRKNSGLSGALIGLGVGTLTGIIIALAEGDDPVYTAPATDIFSGMFFAFSNAFAMKTGEKALVYGTALGTVGGVVGLLVSTVVKKKFIIGGKKEKVRDLQAEMMRKLAIH
jgi:hypothetical protein